MRKRTLWTMLCLPLLIAGCGKPIEQQPVPKEGEIKVVCTIGMITDAVRIIGGDHVDVTAMMGPGVDPHLYKPTMNDVKAIRASQVVFYGGLHLEAKMGDLLEDMSSRKVTKAVTDTIPKDRLTSPPEFDNQHDPHVWFDVTLWIYAVEVIRDTLSKEDPEHAKIYQANAADYLNKLADLHTYVATQAKRIPKNKRVLVTAHDAFGYFGRQYDFEVKGLQGISTVAEAGIKDVQEIVNFIVENKIPAVFIESSVPKRNIEAVQKAAEDKGWNLKIGGELFSDAMGDWDTDEGTYIGMVRHNIDTIVNALAPETP